MVRWGKRLSHEVHTIYDKEIGISRRSSNHDDHRNKPLSEEPSKGCIKGFVAGEER
jgi:hypothetical protein